MKNSVSQPRIQALTVSTPDPQLSTPRPVPPEEVAMRLTFTSIADATTTLAVATIEAALVATPIAATLTALAPTTNLATMTAQAQQLATAIASTLTSQLTATPDLAATTIAQAQQLATLVSATLSALPSPTLLPTPSLTPTSSTTQSPPPTNLPSVTPTLSPTRPPLIATVNTAALNLRTGPGTDYPVVQSYERGTVVTILGKESDEQWIKVETPDGKVGWIATRYLRLSADLTNIAVVETPPTPTPNR